MWEQDNAFYGKNVYGIHMLLSYSSNRVSRPHGFEVMISSGIFVVKPSEIISQKQRYSVRVLTTSNWLQPNINTAVCNINKSCLLGRLHVNNTKHQMIKKSDDLLSSKSANAFTRNLDAFNSTSHLPHLLVFHQNYQQIHKTNTLQCNQL